MVVCVQISEVFRTQITVAPLDSIRGTLALRDNVRLEVVQQVCQAILGRSGLEACDRRRLALEVVQAVVDVLALTLRATFPSPCEGWGAEQQGRGQESESRLGGCFLHHFYLFISPEGFISLILDVYLSIFLV